MCWPGGAVDGLGLDIKKSGGKVEGLGAKVEYAVGKGISNELIRNAYKSVRCWPRAHGLALTERAHT